MPWRRLPLIASRASTTTTWLIVPARSVEEFARLDLQRVCDLTENCDADRNVGSLDGSDIAAANARAFSNIFLRHLTFVTNVAQIGSQNIPKIHAVTGCM
jgi:hypothetical protein